MLAILGILVLATGPAAAASPAGKPTASQPVAAKSTARKQASPVKPSASAGATAKPRPVRPRSVARASSGKSVAATRARTKTTWTAKPRVAAAAPRSTAIAETGVLNLQSGSALIIDESQNEVIYEKNSETRLPIASITKLMSAMVVLDARLPLFEEVEVNEEDVDWLKGSRSRLPLGSHLTRHELLYLALVASENRATSALARSYPGGKDGFVEAMNHKARALGMTDTRFEDPTGLNPANRSTARDLARMVRAAYGYPAIRQITTTPQYTLALNREPGTLEFRNTNRLVRAQTWDIGLSKTGYINEAGRCLVMQADIGERPLVIVLLNGDGRATPFADVVRLKDWLGRRQVSVHSAGRGDVS